MVYRWRGILLRRGVLHSLFFPTRVFSTNSFLTLTNWYLTVNIAQHHLDDPTQRGAGATNLVDSYSHILWVSHPQGSIFIVR